MKKKKKKLSSSSHPDVPFQSSENVQHPPIVTEEENKSNSESLAKSYSWSELAFCFGGSLILLFFCWLFKNDNSPKAIRLYNYFAVGIYFFSATAIFAAAIAFVKLRDEKIKF